MYRKGDLPLDNMGGFLIKATLIILGLIGWGLFELGSYLAG